MKSSPTHGPDARFLRLVQEICVRFISPETLSNILPIAVICFLAGMIDQTLLIRFPGPVRAFWWIAVQSILVGRFAIAAKNGQFHADLFTRFPYRELIPYSVRFITLSLFWAFPIGTVLFLTLPLDEIRLSGLIEWLIARVYLSGSEPFKPSFSFWVLLLGIVAGVILPLLTAVLATMARSPVHAMFPSLWKHPFQAKTSPLVIVVAMLGSLAAAFFLYLPIIGALSVLAFHISPTLGKIFASLAIATPAMAWPIIAGRLAGTWVYFHPISEDADISLPTDEEEVIMPPILKATSSQVTLAPEPPTSPVEPVDAFEVFLDTPLDEIRAILPVEPLEAMKQLLQLKHTHPNEPRILGLEVQILIALNQRSKASNLAINAVVALLKSPYSKEAVAVYNSLGKDRHSLPWENETLDQMSRLFLEAKDFKEAGWCAHTCELQQGHSVRAGKRIVQVADAAAAAKDFSSAVGLLKYYVKHHPDGPFVDYARKAIEFNQKQDAGSHG